MAIRIREAGPEDFPAVIALTERWATEGSTTGHHVENTPEWLQQCVSPYFLVAENDGERVGFLLGVKNGKAYDRLNYQVLQRGETHLSLEQVYVAPEWREQGIGSALMARFRSQAETDGISCIVLTSMNLDWPRTVRFYERYGFRPWYFALFTGRSTAERSASHPEAG